MPKYTKVLVPAVLAVGTMLLTGCDFSADLGASADDEQVTSTTTNSPEDGSAPAGDGKIDPSYLPAIGGSVDCGRKDMGGGETYRLVVDPGLDGLVNCTVAFGVLTEYFAIPANERGNEAINLASDWVCGTIDETGTPKTVDCMKVDPDRGWTYQFAAALVG